MYHLQNVGIDVGGYEGKRSLLIWDSHEPRFPEYKDGTTEFLKRILEKSRENGKNGISVIDDMGSFFSRGIDQQNKDILFAFENAIPKQFAESIKRVCLYHKDALSRISDRERDLLCKCHLQCVVFQ